MAACNNQVGSEDTKDINHYYAGDSTTSKISGVYNYFMFLDSLTESELRLNDSFIYAFTIEILSRDTTETIRVSRSEDRLYYRSLKKKMTVSEIVMPLSGKDNNLLEYKNPKAGFPQKVLFKFKGSDSTIAIYYGVINGKQDSIVRRMYKPIRY